MSSGYIMTLRDTDYVLQKVSKLLIMSKENTLKVLVGYGYCEEVEYMLDNYDIEEDHYVKFLTGIEKNNCCFGLKVYDKYSDVIDFLLSLEIPEDLLADLGVVSYYDVDSLSSRGVLGLTIVKGKFRFVCYPISKAGMAVDID